MCSRCFQFLSSVAGQTAKPTWFCEDDESDDEDAEAGSGAADDVAANPPQRSEATAALGPAPRPPGDSIAEGAKPSMGIFGKTA